MGYKKKKHQGRPFINAWIPTSITSVEGLVAPMGLSADRMRVVVHNLYLCMLNARMKKKNKKSPWLTDGYFTVHNSILHQVATSRYRVYLRILEDAGIIERKLNPTGGKNYLPGIHSQLFRFKRQANAQAAPSFRIERVTDYRCIKSVLTTKAKYAHSEEPQSKNRELYPTHLKLREYVSQAKIDTAVAKRIMGEMDLNPDCDPIDEYDLNYLEALNAKEISWFSVDKYGERCHHPFATLKSEYRPAIRYRKFEDIPLLHLDIKTSQPYFVGAIAAVGVLDKFLPEFAPFKPLIAELNTKPDYRKYMDMCSTGDLYEHVALQMGKSQIEIKKNRRAIKQQFYRSVLFPKNILHGEDKNMSTVFRKEFPSVHHFFKGVKRLKETQFPGLTETIKEWKAKNGAGRKFDKLACAAQRIESRFVTQHIAERLIDADFGPFMTIHDSYLLLPMHQTAAEEIIQDSFRSFHIPPPRLKPELL